ncbi:DUF2723 domain-containing protein, partial [bacterium]|nr:DUF2723 domain-containing protein [bacterium]
MIFCISFTIFSKCTCPTIYVGDSGELVSAASSLGIPHNPGYPIYSMLGKLLTFFPFGPIAYRMNLASAIFGACSVLTIYFILLIFSKNTSLSALMALLYNTFSTLWNVSVSSEVYSLYAFFISLIVLLMLLFRKYKDLPYFYLLVFTSSLAVTNHIEILMIFPAFFPPVIYTFTKLPRLRGSAYKKILLSSILLTFLGFSIYGYLPIRASTNPTVNWSDTKTFSNLLYHISFKEHRTVALTRFSLERTFDRAKELAKFFLNQFPIVFSILFCILSLIGIISLKKQLDILISMLLLFTFDLVYILFFNNVPLNVTAFGYPSYIVSTFLITCGIIRITRYIAENNFFQGFNPIFAGMMFVLFMVSFIFNYHPDNRSNNYCSYNFIRNMMLTPSKSAVLFVDGDNQTFLSLYMKGIEGFRKDLNLYSFTMSSCTSLDSFKGYIYSDVKGSFHSRNIENKFHDKSIFFSANPVNLKHTKLPLRACGLLFKAINVNECNKFENDFWLYQDEDYIQDKNIYKDILTRELTSKYFLRKSGFEYSTGNID